MIDKIRFKVEYVLELKEPLSALIVLVRLDYTYDSYETIIEKRSSNTSNSMGLDRIIKQTLQMVRETKIKLRLMSYIQTYRRMFGFSWRLKSVWESCETVSASATATAAEPQITIEMESVVDGVNSIFEDPKTKDQTYGDHHQSQARA